MYMYGNLRENSSFTEGGTDFRLAYSEKLRIIVSSRQSFNLKILVCTFNY